MNLGSKHKKEVHLYKQRGRAEGFVFLYGVCLLHESGKDIRPDHASQKKPRSV